jgi:EAL domain-containing protein (putative c-di-GMP-specific phosphodiesterase class I)
VTEDAAGTRDFFRLRAEWLRYKNQVVDGNTGLPTLAAVLNDVRRLMEDRGTVLLVYLDLAGDAGYETLHGWHAYDDALRAFGRTLSGLRSNGLMSPSDLLAVMAVRSDKFLLFLGGTGAPLGPRSGDDLARRVRTAVEQAFPGQLRKVFPAPLGFHSGHALMRRDPMLRAESAVHRALDGALFMSLRRRSREADRRERALDDLLRTRDVLTMYQPILDLAAMRVLGHEVASRGIDGGPFEDAEVLFAVAERTGRLLELERVCRTLALGCARRHLAPEERLFLGTSAVALRDSATLGGGLVRDVARAGLTPPDVVLQVTERVAAEERRSYHDALRELKRDGFRIAIDDMGAGYSSLKALVEIEPDYMKFDVSMVRQIDRSPIKRSLLETLVDLARKIGAEVIAEGVEAEPELHTLRELGVRLGQGSFLAQPIVVSPGSARAS